MASDTTRRCSTGAPNRRDAIAGSAPQWKRNSGVGVGESEKPAASESVVFEQKAATMGEVVDACRTNFANNAALSARLRNAAK